MFFTGVPEAASYEAAKHRQSAEYDQAQRDAAEANRRAALVMVLAQGITRALQASTFNSVRVNVVRAASLAADDILAQQP